MHAIAGWTTRFSLITAAMTLVALGLAVPSRAAILVHYDFASSSASSLDTDQNSVASLFADGDGTFDSDTVKGNSSPSVFKSYADMPASLAFSLRY